MPDMPHGVLGFRVDGDIEREDYERVLAPALRAALESGEKLRTLYLIEDLDDIAPAALVADAKLGFDLGIRHRSAWERSAIVTDVEWMTRAARLFAWMIPGEARVYPIAELEAATAWVAGTAE
jgi:hypothetical protein